MTIQQAFFFQRSGIGATSGNIEATGGNISISGGYKIHTFTSTGTLSVTAVNNHDSFEYLVVAGGGGGGTSNFNIAAGGGAGGLLQGKFPPSSENYTITIGSGGPVSTQGGNSSIGPIIVATGGGKGGNCGENLSISAGSGGNGGSGGGGGFDKNDNFAPGNGIVGQGYTGSYSDGNTSIGSGGGAGGPGIGTTGGVGITTDISGSSIVYATGAGGGSVTGAGTANRGNGGKYNSSGGSGIVIIRYPYIVP